METKNKEPKRFITSTYTYEVTKSHYHYVTEIPHDGVKKIDKKLMFGDKALIHWETLPDTFWEINDLMLKYDIRLKKGGLMGTLELVGGISIEDKYENREGYKDGQFYVCALWSNSNTESRYFNTIKDVIAHINKGLGEEWNFCIFPEQEDGGY
tara:strand:- start:603 stop:1064 length:462 start_codon:yes stop_codon:yes gene_type:complete